MQNITAPVMGVSRNTFSRETCIFFHSLMCLTNVVFLCIVFFGVPSRTRACWSLHIPLLYIMSYHKVHYQCKNSLEYCRSEIKHIREPVITKLETRFGIIIFNDVFRQNLCFCALPTLTSKCVCQSQYL